MSKKITRTFETHEILAAEVNAEDGKVSTTNLPGVEVFNQSINTEKALKIIQKTYGKKKQYVILGITTTKETYGIDFDKFMELAEIVE